MKYILFSLILFSCSFQNKEIQKINNKSTDYQTLINLFYEWREFENPPLLNGAPDYTKERFKKNEKNFKDLQNRLNQISIDNWSVPQQIDWHIVRAEMNGYDFNYKILQPWVRDPAYYQTIWMNQSDVPAHEGPTNHGTLEFWTYKFPLTNIEEKHLKDKLKIIPIFLEQARGNLTGNARDLWIAGIENFKQQIENLKKISEKFNESNSDILDELKNAKKATKDFITWLEEQASKKTGPSGIGKENYTWYQQNVHLLPLTWEEEVQLLQRELDRAWSSLKLEEHKNRDLPELIAADTPEEFAILTELGVQRFMRFLKEKEIMPIKENMEPALREHMGKFVPKDKRNFFNIGLHLDPLPLYSHFVHWFDLAEIRDNPHKSPIRKGPLLYNIFDSKNEGIATGVEEMFMHAGLYNDSPRSKEIVWIMIAQRAARGLGSLYAHANEMTMAEAGNVHVKWTPRGWMNREPHLLYAEKLEKEGKEFTLKDFFKKFNDAGSIPINLVRWEMTGRKSN